MSEEREILIERLMHPMFHDGTRISRKHADELTDTIMQLIAEDRRKVLEQVRKPLDKKYDFSGKTDMWAVAQWQADDIDEALTEINKHLEA